MTTKTEQEIFDKYDDRAGNRSGYLDDVESCWTDENIKQAIHEAYEAGFIKGCKPKDALLQNKSEIQAQTAQAIFADFKKLVEDTTDEMHCEKDTDLTTIDMFADKLKEGYSRTDLGLKELEQKYLKAKP